jgi:hypothetical protein
MRMPEYLQTNKRDGRALDEVSDAVDEGACLLFVGFRQLALTAEFGCFSEHRQAQGAGAGRQGFLGLCCQVRLRQEQEGFQRLRGCLRPGQVVLQG